MCARRNASCPCLSYRPSKSEPSDCPSFDLRQPMTTQSAVRWCLIFTQLPLARNVSAVPRLRDHAIQPRALELLEPLLGRLGVSGVRGQEEGRLGALEQLLETLAPIAQRQRAQVLVTFREQVEGDIPRRGGGAEHANARVGRVDALLQGAEIEPSLPHHDRARRRGRACSAPATETPAGPRESSGSSAARRG